MTDIWFHRYRDGVDIEGRFDYNSWVESDKGRKLSHSLDRDVVLAEGYKEYDTGREYMARMGDWRNNKDEELNLDGIGGVNILVKADVHRSGKNRFSARLTCADTGDRYQFSVLRFRKSSRNRGLREDGQACWLPSSWSSKLRGLGK